MSDATACRRTSRRRLASGGALLLAGVLAAGGLSADEPHAPVVRLTQMTFLASEGERAQLLLEADDAEIPGDSDVAYLKGVRGRVAGTQGAEGGLDMSCDRAQYHLDTNDFVAEGTVRGRTGDGRRFQTTLLRYNHAEALAVSDAPVTIWDRHGRYRGGGFRYHVGEGRFQLLDGATVTQQ